MVRTDELSMDISSFTDIGSCEVSFNGSKYRLIIGRYGGESDSKKHRSNIRIRIVSMLGTADILSPGKSGGIRRKYTWRGYRNTT